MGYYEQKAKGIKVIAIVAVIALIVFFIGDALITGGMKSFAEDDSYGDYEKWDDDDPFGSGEDDENGDSYEEETDGDEGDGEEGNDDGNQDGDDDGQDGDNGENEDKEKEENEKDTFEVNYNNDLLVYPTLSESDKKLYRAIYKAIVEHKSCKYKCKESQAEKISDRLSYIFYAGVIADNPQIFWVDPFYGYGWDYDKNGDCFAYLELTYLLSKSEAEDYLRKMNAKIDKLVEGKDFSSDYDKAMWAYKWLADNVTYNTAAVEEKEDIENEWLIRRSWGVFFDGTSVCEGYARAFQLLMYKLDVPCTTVSGNADSSPDSGHSWNVARVDGINAHFDPTWGDGMYEDGSSFIDYEYFGCSEKQLTKQGRTKWDNSIWPPCTSTEIYERANKDAELDSTTRRRIIRHYDPKMKPFGQYHNGGSYDFSQN